MQLRILALGSQLRTRTALADLLLLGRRSVIAVTAFAESPGAVRKHVIATMYAIATIYVIAILIAVMPVAPTDQFLLLNSTASRT